MGWCVLWIQEHFLTALLSWPPAIPAPGVVSGTCTAPPLLFIGIPSCGFLPFYFFICKFTFLTSVNLIHQSLSVPAEKGAMLGSPTFDIPRLNPHRSLFYPVLSLQTEMHVGQICKYKVWPVAGLEHQTPDFCRDGVFQGQVGSSGVLLCLMRCIQVQNLWGEFAELSLLSPNQLWG